MNPPAPQTEPVPVAALPQRAGALTGVAWLLAFRVVDRLIGIVSFLVLARLLLPEHFGVIALATAVIAFIEILTSLGLDTILVQVRDPTRAHYDTAWTIQAAMAALCAVLIAGAAYPAAAAMREPRLAPVLCMLALSFAIEGLQNIRLVDYRREMRFDKEFLFLASRRLVTVCVTIASAFLLRNEWALAIGMLASRIVGTTLSYLMRPYRPRFTLELKGEFATKSSWLLLSSVVMFLRQRSSDFVLGRMHGVASVGTYALAQDLSMMVTMELVVPINRVTLSDLSARRTKEDLVERFNVVSGVVAVVLTPLGLGLAGCAPDAVVVLFGPAWAAAGAVVQLLALANLLSALVSNLGVPFISLGQYRLNFICHAVGAGTLVPLLLLGVNLYGAQGAAAAVLVANLVATAISMHFAKRVMDYGLRRLAACIWRPVVAGVIMFAAMQFVPAAFESFASLPAPVRLVAELVIGAICYPAALFSMWGACGFPDGAERRVLNLIGRVLRRIPGLAAARP